MDIFEVSKSIFFYIFWGIILKISGYVLDYDFENSQSEILKKSNQIF